MIATKKCTKLLIFFLFKEKSPLSFTFFAVLKIFSRANLLLNKTRSHSPRFAGFHLLLVCFSVETLSASSSTQICVQHIFFFYVTST